MEAAAKFTGIVSVVVTILLSYSGTEALSCYNCTSTSHGEKCGISVGFTKAEEIKYKVECEGVTMACRKLVTRDAPKDIVLVTRSCWNSSAVEKLSEDFLSCNKVMGTGEVCYCDKEYCNGKQSLLASTLNVLVPLVLAIFMVVIQK